MKSDEEIQEAIERALAQMVPGSIIHLYGDQIFVDDELARVAPSAKEAQWN